jgi:hypothetical protein
MIDPFVFAQSQKMTWVKHLLYENDSSTWKSIELSALKSFHSDTSILWKAYAPEKILTKLNNSQISDSLRSWYYFRDMAAQDLGFELSELKLQGGIWFNKHIRTKSKQYFYYAAWFERGIYNIVDLLYTDMPTPVLKSFDDLIIEFDIPYTDRRKYNSLCKSIVEGELLDDATVEDCEFFDAFSNNILLAPKVPRYCYHMLVDKTPPVKAQLFWEDLLNSDEEALNLEWEDVHSRNFSCTIETQLRAFYFKVFYRAIAFNNCLHKIGRKDSPLCSLCNRYPETTLHVFL